VAEFSQSSGKNRAKVAVEAAELAVVLEEVCRCCVKLFVSEIAA